METFREFFPWIVGLVAVLFVLALILFAFYRADAIRAGEKFPTKLATQQTYSTIRKFLRLSSEVRRAPNAPDDRRAPRVMTEEEMKATITPGTLRAEDIPPLLEARRRRTPTHHRSHNDNLHD